MNGYALLLFLHVVSVIVWLGAGTTLAVLALVGEPPERLAALGRMLGPRVFAPASLGTLAFGLALVADGHWTVGPLWVRLGLGAFGLSFVLNVGARMPLLRRLGRGGRGAARAGRALALLPRFELVLLYLTVADMVAKPSGADTGTLAVGGAILAAAALAVAAGVARGGRSGGWSEGIVQEG